MMLLLYASKLELFSKRESIWSKKSQVGTWSSGAKVPLYHEALKFIQVVSGQF